MNNPNNKIETSYEILLSRQQTTADLLTLLQLLFDDDETIQFKERKNIHPWNASYLRRFEAEDFVKDVIGKWSDDGHRYCCNAIPESFIERLNEIANNEAVQQDTFDQIASKLKDELSLQSDLFPNARTFFVEADNDANGNPIDTIEAKKKALEEILATGLPFSFITDTGGRVPHIGIVFQEKLSLKEFRQMVKLVLSRLPPWIDTGVGHVNQLGRLPTTFRTNKEGQRVEVKLLHIGERLSKNAVDQWINQSPILNPDVLKLGFEAPQKIKYELSEDELLEAEEFAWRYIADNGLKSAKRAVKGKILVSCPKAENHRSGKDRNMSAVIWVETGRITCSACGGTVAKILKSGHTLFPTQTITNPSEIKSSRLF